MALDRPTAVISPTTLIFCFDDIHCIIKLNGLRQVLSMSFEAIKFFSADAVLESEKNLNFLLVRKTESRILLFL